METDFITQTVKLKLLVNDEENFKKKLYWLACAGKEARNLKNDAMRECISHYQKQLNKKRFSKNSKKKELSYLQLMAENRKEYKYLSKTFKTETHKSALEWQIMPLFTKWKKEKDKSGIPFFKEVSLPVLKKSKIKYENDNYILIPTSLNKIEFKIIDVKKDKYILDILNNVISGTYILCDSQIKRDKNRHWNFYLSYKMHKKINTEKFISDLVCGVDVGWSVPACVGLNIGKERAYLGDSKHLQRFKTQIKSRRRILQKNRNLLSTGHGKQKSMKALNRLSEKESNFVHTFNHTISKQIIDFCIKNKVGCIHMEHLSADVKKNKFLTAYWSYYQLQQMIEYKANKEGIKVFYVNAAYTSQTCSKCGHVSKENRKTQSEFKCVECEYELNADYNASVNIARSNQFVENKIEDEDSVDVA